jgi:hypothetical protein
MDFTRAIRGWSLSILDLTRTQIATAFEQASGQNGLVLNTFGFEDTQFIVLSRPHI